MKNKSIYAVLTRFGIIGAVLATLVLIAPVVSAADPIAIDYPENGTDAVLTFSATDADGDEIEWGLGGTDAADFDITGGVLSFKKSPDFEGATDRDEIPNTESVGAQGAGDGVYKIIVQASGGSQPVEVTVTNVDEDGSVDFTQPQPQVSREIVASFKDDDGKGEPSWQWSMGPSAEGPWTEIAGQTKANRNPTADEVDNYLRATVSYTDSFGSQTASGVTERPVEEKTLANAQPAFGDIDPIAINENMTGAIGDPVTASDDDNDVLLYGFGTLDTIPNDNDLFNIAERTGQLSVMSEDGIDFETPGEGKAPNTDTTGNIPVGVIVYTVVITATDPSGAPGTGPVSVYLSNVNEPPTFGDAKDQTTLYIAEDGENGESNPGIFTDMALGTLAGDYAMETVDEDTVDETVVYFLEGAPTNTFAIGVTTGVLSTNDAFRANFEGTPSYSLVVIARSGAEAGGREMFTRLGVAVKVVDQEDVGTVEISALEPQVGRAVVATLKEEDKDVTGVVWQWFRGGAQGEEVNTFVVLTTEAARASNLCSDSNTGADDDPCIIDGGTGPVYTPVAADADGEGLFIHAVATYTDGLGDGAENASGAPVERVQTSDPANTAPKFPDQDHVTAGDQSDSTMRSVAENDDSATVGEPVTAGDGDTDRLLYSLGGDDASMFKVARVSGQISTTAELDFEADDEHTVVVTATDPSGATDSIMVVIAVTDENDKPVISGVEEVSVAEGTTAVATFTATDEDGDDIEWDVAGVDAGAFEISDDGELTFKDAPNFEAKADKDEDDDSRGLQGASDNIFRVTVKANAGSQAVAVTVTNVNEDGSVDFDQPQPQVTRNLKADFSDQDGEDMPTWQWAMGPSDEGPWTDITGATMSARKPTASEAGSYLRATVTYTDSFGEQTASGVTDNPVEDRTLSNAGPTFKDDIVIAINENQTGAIGDPVLASDDDNDELLYSFGTVGVDNADGPDANDNLLFNIGERSGQLSVKGDDGIDFEPAAEAGDRTVSPADTDDGIPDGALIYTVVITATDPSGAPGTGVVMVALKNVNEAPEFDSDSKDKKTLYVIENADPYLLRQGKATTDEPAGDYTATDEDTADPDTDVEYILEGAGDEEDSFTLSETDGAIALVSGFGANFEGKPSYSLTIVASSGDDDRVMYARLPVTVMVVNAEDRGTVELNAREPQVGRPVLATLDDKDGGVTGVSWKWYRGGGALPDPVAEVLTTLDARPACDPDDVDTAVNPSASVACEIGGAAGSALYTPGADDVGWLLHAVAAYTDMIENPDRNNDENIEDLTELAGVSSEYVAQAGDPANTAPVFPDQDLNAAGDQSDMAVRSVAENDKGARVGEPVSAGDADGDALMFSLSGDDADMFTVTNNGQIKTAVELDYEALPEDAKYHMVTLMAQDPSTAYDKIMVQINVTDADDGAVISLRPSANVAPAFADDAATEISVMENMPAGAIGDPYTATDENGDTLTYSLSGSDYFEIDDMGQISTTMMLDHEAMDSHMVTVMADDGSGDENATASIDVTVAVGDMHPDCTVMDNMGLTNDCEALLDAKDDLGGSLNWDTDTAMADWEGVTMSDGRVSGIWLKDEGLDGSVSAALGRLEMLTVLNLHSNSLSGEIPDLSGASMLEDLYLAGNADYVTNDDGKKVKVDGTGLTGEIPMWLNGMTNLTNLWLWGNQLTGGIPDLSGLTNLDMLKLADNDLTGNINAMYLPQNVSWLIIDRNGFDGSIPDLSGLMNLKLLWLHTNALTGAIPDGTMLPASLDDLNLRDNMLTGMIPDLSALDNLTRLRLHNNSLSGAVPGSLGGLDSLKQLWLHNETDEDGMLIGNNMFTSIDDGVGGLSLTLIEIQLGGNRWADDACVPAALADVATNDYEAAGIAVCGADDGS